LTLEKTVLLVKNKFRFKKWWLEKEDFKDIVAKALGLECKLTGPMNIWQFRIMDFRRLVKGWANNVIAEMNKYKQAIAAEFNFLDMEAESRILENEENLRLKFLAKELDHI
jgi:hypothetical protein